MCARARVYIYIVYIGIEEQCCFGNTIVKASTAASRSTAFAARLESSNYEESLTIDSVYVSLFSPRDSTDCRKEEESSYRLCSSCSLSCYSGCVPFERLAADNADGFEFIREHCACFD